MAAFINGNVVAIPEEVVADMERMMLFAEIHAKHGAGLERDVQEAKNRLQTFLKTYKESN